ncbi:MAG: ABC-type transport auxiliary lipoprotein family protein [Marinobacter sp.]|nr:ABC-type transport auxiliary lipoprotein family protein [Marinobacter sp.]
MKIALLKACLLGMTVTLSACSIFPEQEAPRLVGLAPPSSPTQFDETREASLRIDTPLATAPFDSTRVLIKPDTYEFQALPGARWRDSAPVLLREYMVQYFRQSGGFDSVLTDTNPASAELTLISELSGFHAVIKAGRNTVVVNLYAELLDNRTRVSLCTQDHQIQIPANSTSHSDLMAAFSAGAEALSEQALVWAFDCSRKA